MAWKRFKTQKRKYRKYAVKKLRARALTRWTTHIESFPLFQSLWFQSFINSLVLHGKKNKITNIILRSLISLKSIYGSSPLLIIFEILELARFPLRVRRRRKGRKVYTWLDLLPWWRQYGLTLSNLRQVVRLRGKSRTSLPQHLINEFISIREIPGKSKLFQKKLALGQLATEARLEAHYRWRR
jgi:ribosomal protein S7